MTTEGTPHYSPADRFRNYSDFQELGKGGIGKVETCFDGTLHRRIAIKSLHSHTQSDPEQQNRFVREARVMASMEHPNIVPVHELGTKEDGSYYFTMKEVKGVTLAEILKRLRIGNKKFAQQWPFQSLMDIFMGICNAVSFAHSNGVIHRDLKPVNILVGEFGEVIVLDWGLAKHVDAPHDEEGIYEVEASSLSEVMEGQTLEGSVRGTPDYMAPEQASGEVGKQDERTDIYALGGILYEILTLQGTVQSIRLDEILKEINSATITPPREAVRCSESKPYPGLIDVPRELDAICMKALAKNRDDRYGSVADMVHNINCWRNHLPVAICPDSPLQKARKWCARHLILSSILITAVSVLVIAGTTISTTRALRHRSLMNAGNEHLVEGSKLASENLVEIFRLRGLEKTGIEAESLTSIRNKIEERQRQIETKYAVASILYAQAAPIGDPRVHPALSELHGNLLRHALLLEDKEKVRQRLNFIREWAGEHFENTVTEETRKWLRDTAAWTKGDTSIPTLSLVGIKEHEEKMLQEAGIDYMEY